MLMIVILENLWDYWKFFILIFVHPKGHMELDLTLRVVFV
jgi:hypothetical protein